jgi:dihydroorotate dehydrogenase
VSFYTAILQPLLFRLEAERAHRFALRQIALLPPTLLRLIFGATFRSASCRVFGVHFPNPVGLAAGMDKNAIALSGWEALGFGFVEVGTVTASAQEGNPRPRLFRYPRQKALVNRMGFNNDGADAVSARLERRRKAGKWPKIPLGINIGKSRSTPLDQAPDDYLYSFRLLRKFGDYFVINVSSPNTPGLRDLQESLRLQQIIRALRREGAERPLLVKIAPDLADERALEIAELCESEGIAGLLATNTTLDHSALPKESDEEGGLSGEPLRGRATQLLRILNATTSLPLVGSGGVMDVFSAKEKFDAGAALVQIYTGLVYRGPQLVREIALLNS